MSVSLTTGWRRNMRTDRLSPSYTAEQVQSSKLYVSGALLLRWFPVWLRRFLDGGDCLRSARSVSTVGHIKDRTSGPLENVEIEYSRPSLGALGNVLQSKLLLSFLWTRLHSRQTILQQRAIYGNPGCCAAHLRCLGNLRYYMNAQRCRAFISLALDI